MNNETHRLGDGLSLAPHKLRVLLGPLWLVTLCAVPLVLWAGSAPIGPRFEGRYAALTSVAVLSALAGTSAFALNLVLGARLHPVQALFGGLEQMYKAHRLNGEIAFVLLLGHVVLILASRATISTSTALDLLRPSAGWTVMAGVLAFAGMTIAIVLTLFIHLGHELFVYVQRSFGIVFLGATYHVFTTGGALESSRALNLYMASLATLGIGAYLYRSVLGNLLVRRSKFRVAGVNRLDEFVTEVVMEPGEAPLAYAPGQFVFVNFREPFSDQFPPFARNQFHPFSITSAPSERKLRITVKAVGDYTRALRSLEPGVAAVVEGPYGAFSSRDVANDSQVWIAGGIGVTPFLSMARSLNGDGPAVDFYYCVEHEPEAHFVDELRSIEREREDFRVVVVPRDREGFLTAERLAGEKPDLQSADVLICGPPEMIVGLRSQLRDRGLPSQRIHAEEFSFAKIGRRPAAETSELAPSGLATDPKLFASVAAVAFAGPALALAVLVGSYFIARGR
jgi:predicted ferric reductase